ncbi:MAG: ParB N-terminal domain-containing protein [Minisyncoccia bacterium]
MTDIIWKNEKRKVKDLSPAEYNPRKITEVERQDLMKSISEFGAVVPVVINLDNKMIGGHQRLSIYADLQMDEIDVQVPSRQLNLEEEMRLNLRLNKNVAGWDWALLDKNFEDDFLKGVGFTDEELLTNFGIQNAEDEDVDESRMDVLQVVPPEAPRIKDRATIHFSDMKNYEAVKKLIEEKKITEADLIQLIKQKA